MLYLTDPAFISNFLAPTLSVIGHLIIGIVVLSVHMHVAEERSIDKEVVKYMRKEQFGVVLGIIFVIAGYALEMVF